MNCEKIIDNYIHWIKDNTCIKMMKNGRSCEVTTPFLDRHNDHLQVYVVKYGNKYKLTDDGETINDLLISGMEIKTEKRIKVLETTLNGFGVKIAKNDEIFVEADIENIGQKKHYLIQAILAVNDMYVLSSENVLNFFKEDVDNFFQTNEVIYTQDVGLVGKSGISHNFDFIIPPKKRIDLEPEKLVKTMNTPNKNNVELALFHFDDVAKVRENMKSYVFYNDIEKKISSDSLSALLKYEIVSIPWSKREEYKKEFV